jgi:hypothetical protein
LIPEKVLNSLNTLSAKLATSAFIAHLTIFAVAIARWSGRDRFLIRSIADLRSTKELAQVVGMMHGSDTIDIHAQPQDAFETTLRNVAIEYRASLKARLPCFNAFPPHLARPDAGDLNTANNVAALFNYRAYKMPNFGDGRDDSNITGSWPPSIKQLPIEPWSITISPIWFNLNDVGDKAFAEIQFNEVLISRDEQITFLKLFLDGLSQAGDFCK